MALSHWRANARADGRLARRQHGGRDAPRRRRLAQGWEGFRTWCRRHHGQTVFRRAAVRRAAARALAGLTSAARASAVDGLLRLRARRWRLARSLGRMAAAVGEDGLRPQSARFLRALALRRLRAACARALAEWNARHPLLARAVAYARGRALQLAWIVLGGRAAEARRADAWAAAALRMSVTSRLLAALIALGRHADTRTDVDAIVRGYRLRRRRARAPGMMRQWRAAVAVAPGTSSHAHVHRLSNALLSDRRRRALQVAMASWKATARRGGLQALAVGVLVDRALRRLASSSRRARRSSGHVAAMTARVRRLQVQRAVDALAGHVPRCSRGGRSPSVAAWHRAGARVLRTWHWRGSVLRAARQAAAAAGRRRHAQRGLFALGDNQLRIASARRLCERAASAALRLAALRASRASAWPEAPGLPEPAGPLAGGEDALHAPAVAFAFQRWLSRALLGWARRVVASETVEAGLPAPFRPTAAGTSLDGAMAAHSSRTSGRPPQPPYKSALARGGKENAWHGAEHTPEAVPTSRD